MHTDWVEAPSVGEYFPATQSKHLEAPDDAPVKDDNDHTPLNPLLQQLLCDVNVTLRNPVDELYTLDELTDPERLTERSIDSVSYHKIVT